MKRKVVVANDDDDDDMADVIPALTQAEHNAWIFFQEPECSEIIELFNQS
jgi:hypothetical protein